jgi:hypothetical protein
LRQQHNDDGHDCLSPIFSALGQNTGLKRLNVSDFGSVDESLCTAIKYGLGLNETLESLDLDDVPLLDANADLWYRALSFLHNNKTLKSLTVTLKYGVRESCVSAFRIDIAVILQENTSLENLFIYKSRDGLDTIEAEEYIAIVTTVQQNNTLRILQFCNSVMLELTDNEDKQMASLLKKNYALERLQDVRLDGDARAILQLNKAGRRYLIEDGSSISKGVEVLSAVSTEIDCVFLHLLENPRLCDRRAVEAASDGTDNGGSMSPVHHIGKREHGRTQNEGKESRRRLT